MREMPFTPIYEAARNELKITRDEYALCCCVQFWASDPESKVPGWCDEPKEDIAKWIGITRPGLYGMIKRMVNKDLIEQHPTGAYLRITKRWFNTITNARADIELRKATVKKVYSQTDQVESDDCKESLQPVVKKVYSKRKESLQPNTKVISKEVKGSKRIGKAVAVATGQKPEKKERKFPDWMPSDFDAAHEKLFPGIGFSWQKKHFSDAGLSGLFDTLKARFKKQKGSEPTDEDIRKAFAAFLSAAATIDWIVEKGFFDPCKLKSQFNTIAETNAKKKAVTVNGRTNAVTDSPKYQSPEFFKAQ